MAISAIYAQVTDRGLLNKYTRNTMIADLVLGVVLVVLGALIAHNVILLPNSAALSTGLMTAGVMNIVLALVPITIALKNAWQSCGSRVHYEKVV